MYNAETAAVRLQAKIRTLSNEQLLEVVSESAGDSSTDGGIVFEFATKVMAERFTPAEQLRYYIHCLAKADAEGEQS